jgi:hypothetical protein
MFGLTLALFLGSAQTPPPADDGIVVTGTRYTREEARRRAAEFVDRMGIGADDRPVARWGDAVCPRVQGIERRLAERVEARMRAAAEAAAVPVAPAGCVTNIVVHFTADAGPVMRRLALRAPRYLEDVHPAARQALFEGRAPVRWVYASETRQIHGSRATEGGATWATIDGGQGGGSAFGTIPTVMNYNSSMVSTQTARVLTGAAIVVDANLATGRLLDSVADYVAFVAFAEVRPNDPAPENSILTLFRDSGGAPALTGWDNAFLTALYRIPLDRMGRRHRGMLVSELVTAARDAGRATP